VPEGPGMASYSSLCSASQTDTSRCLGLLPALLSVIASSADVTSFLGLGLFSSPCNWQSGHPHRTRRGSEGRQRLPCSFRAALILMLGQLVKARKQLEGQGRSLMVIQRTLAIYR
jgi:hypothetical protein